MNAEQIKWLMEVLRKGLYAELGVGAFGFLTFGLAMMERNLPGRVFFVIFGLIIGIMGIALCFLSGVVWDKFNAELRAVETTERKEHRKEEKRSRKEKAKPKVLEVK